MLPSGPLGWPVLFSLSRFAHCVTSLSHSVSHHSIPMVQIIKHSIIICSLPRISLGLTLGPRYDINPLISIPD